MRSKDAGKVVLSTLNIAISGGSDSVALTQIFYSFLKKIDLRLGIRKKK